MKRYIRLLLLFALAASLVLAFASCRERIDARELLEYVSSTSQCEISFLHGNDEYTMRMSLDPFDAEKEFREGSATIVGGVLDGVSFVMLDEALEMRIGEYSSQLARADASAIYSIFSVFSLRAEEFVGAASDVEGVLAARFSGTDDVTLFLDLETHEPIRAQCNDGACTIVFETKGTA